MPSLQTLRNNEALRRIDYEVIRGPSGARLLLSMLDRVLSYDGPIGVDTETTGLDPHVNQVRLVQLGSRSEEHTSELQSH